MSRGATGILRLRAYLVAPLDTGDGYQCTTLVAAGATGAVQEEQAQARQLWRWVRGQATISASAEICSLRAEGWSACGSRNVSHR